MRTSEITLQIAVDGMGAPAGWAWEDLPDCATVVRACHEVNPAGELSRYVATPSAARGDAPDQVTHLPRGMHMNTEETRTRVGEIIDAVSDAMTSLPDPAAVVLARHAETASPSTDPPISSASLLADAALYQGSTTPALVLAMVGRTGRIYLEGSADDAEYQASVHRDEGDQAWWHPLTADGTWRESPATA